MTGRQRGIVALACLAFVLGLWASTAVPEPLWSPGTVGTSLDGPARPAVPDEETTDDDGSEAGLFASEGNTDIFVPLLVVAAALLVVVVWGNRAFARRRRSRRDAVRAAAAGAPSLGTQRPVVPAGLVEAAARSEQTLLEGDPRNAIVACWLELERAADTVGLPRRRAETTAEFAARVLSTYAVDATAITTLAGLYREARFSVHPLTEQHRRHAVDALALLRSHLDAVAVAASARGSH